MSTKIININCPIVISKFKNFEDIQQELLEIINNKSSCFMEKLGEDPNCLVKTDFPESWNKERLWMVYAEKYIFENIDCLLKDIGFNNWSIDNIWFQQYNNNVDHEWHTHANSNYSGVFYLEMPSDGPKTEFVNPENKEIFSLDMKVGDIAIFPAHLSHRSPKNESKKIKTIISFNINIHPDKEFSVE